MTPETSLWTYSLAPDVIFEAFDGGAFLRTPTGRTRMSDPDELRALKLLTEGHGSSEAQICERIGPGGSDRDAQTRSAALLFRLDQLGLLSRTLNSRAGPLLSCIPLRPPPVPQPQRPPIGQLRLSSFAMAYPKDDLMSLEVPGAWARIAFHDRGLLALLHDLAIGRTAANLVALATGYHQDAILAVLATMSWCGLFEQADTPDWSRQDLLLHTRTRGGYARVQLAKTSSGGDTAAHLARSSDATQRLVLERPELVRLRAEDPPYALVSEQRRSIRRQGSEPLDQKQLSEFLFRTLHEQDGRRPYPSGGACYPLAAYLVVHRCLGVAPGLYAYDPKRHELIMMAQSGAELDVLLVDAANAAGVAEPPQVLLVLAARFARTRQIYNDLSYSLILKEVGAVFQAGMMAAAAMKLSTCPLGSGNSLLFSKITGLDPLVETSVGEMMLGSLEATSSGRKGPD